MQVQIGDLKISLDRHETLNVLGPTGDINWTPVWFDALWEWEGKMIYLTLFSISLSFDWQRPF